MACGRTRTIAIATVLSGLFALLMSAAGHAQGPVSDPQDDAHGPAPSAAVESPAAQASLGATDAAVAGSPEAARNRASPSFHPLWRLPLSELTAIRDRPIFSATRRPPPATETPPLPTSVSSPAKEITRPPLSLLGAIAADEAGIAVFLDEVSRRTIRLKVGEGYAGWTLQLVKPREATLIRDQHTAIVALPPPR
jgi:general secretion pathway protein N